MSDPKREKIDLEVFVNRLIEQGIQHGRASVSFDWALREVPYQQPQRKQ